MARLLIVEPEADFHTLFDAALAQAGYVAVEAANSYEGQPAADAVCLAAVTRNRRAPRRAPLLLVEAAAQFHAFFRDVLDQEGYVVTAAVHSAAGQPAAAVRRDIRYLVVY
jgi:hypothetical protein